MCQMLNVYWDSSSHAHEFVGIMLSQSFSGNEALPAYKLTFASQTMCGSFFAAITTISEISILH